MAPENKFKIPSTQIRLSQSVEFSGYIYPQIISTLGDIASLALQFTRLTPIAGITKVTKKIKRPVTVRKFLGKFMYDGYQSVPLGIEVNLDLDRAVFYQDKNELDTILQLNADGTIKQFMPFMIIETRRDPKGNQTNIVFVDCWINSESYTYQLDGDLKVVNTLSITAARLSDKIDFAKIPSSLLPSTTEITRQLNSPI